MRYRIEEQMAETNPAGSIDNINMRPCIIMSTFAWHSHNINSRNFVISIWS